MGGWKGRVGRAGDPGGTTRVAVVAAVAVIASLAAPPVAPLYAQEPTATEDDEPSIGCWRGRPLPECRSFWLFEVQGNLLLAGGDRTSVLPDGQSASRDAFDSSLEWNLGHMVNVSERVAVGGMVTLGTGSSDALTGLKARGRWWLHRDYSVELGAGALKTDLTGSLSGDPLWGVTADVRVNIQDRGSFFLRWDGVNVPEGGRFGEPQPREDFKNAIYAGVGLGSDWAAIATAAGGIGYLVLLGVFLAGSD